MTIRIPDTLVGQSEKYIVSIRLEPGGLSFSGYNPLEGNSFFYHTVAFDRPQTYLASLKECFFANECLSWKYKRLYVVCPRQPYTLVPLALYDERRKEALMAFNCSDSLGHVLNNPLPEAEAVLLFSLLNEEYEFCSRSLVAPHFLHSVTPLLTQWLRQGKTSLYKQMYVHVSGQQMDVACLAPQGRLSLANTFEAKTEHDVLYYLLYIWKQEGMNQLKDQLYLSGEQAKSEELRKTLRLYLRHISPVSLPSEVYLRGNDLLQAPLDLIYLSICEL